VRRGPARRRATTTDPGLYQSPGAVLAVRVEERRIRPAGGDGGASPRPEVGPEATQAVVAVDRRGGAVRIGITGEVDLANAETTEQQILDAINDELEEVTLDLTGLRYIDSAGLWILFRLGAHLASSKIDGEVLVLSDGPVWRMVHTAGVAAAIAVRSRP
jgi:anti-anti-sigma factor